MSERALEAEHEEVLEAASAWVVRLAAGDADDLPAFDAWIAGAPSRREAFDAALSVWTAMQAAAPEVLRGLVAGERRRAEVMARRAWLAASAVAAALVASVWVWPQREAPVTPQVYVTGVGEHRTVRLADGSRVDLNAGTRITVAYARDARRVELAAGEAIFDVVHAASRPFLVAAGDRTVRVVGTRFDVRRRDGQLSVTVDRGLVEVRPAGQLAGGGYRLHPGQQLTHREGAGERLALVSAEEALSWREGRLVFRDQPLATVIAELNQQFRRPIRLADPTLGPHRVTGVLVLDDEQAVVRRLARLAPVTPVGSEDGFLLGRGLRKEGKRRSSEGGHALGSDTSAR